MSSKTVYQYILPAEYVQNPKTWSENDNKKEALLPSTVADLLLFLVLLDVSYMESPGPKGLAKIRPIILGNLSWGNNHGAATVSKNDESSRYGAAVR